MKENINKVVYFDKETINNVLQELDKGDKSTKVDTNVSTSQSAKAYANVKIKLSTPILKRLSFLFTGEMELSYIRQKDKTTTITSTEISEFKRLKPILKEIKNIEIKDIENSSTFFRVAGGYLRMIKGEVEGIDTKEFKTVMDSYDGYDTYKVQENTYVRFNNSAFLSNYKRNDLLTTKMTIYCVFIGEFKKEKFDFFEQITRMESLITGVESNTKLSDVYPLKGKDDIKQSNCVETTNTEKTTLNEEFVNLYDVVYAAIPFGGSCEG